MECPPYPLDDTLQLPTILSGFEADLYIDEFSHSSPDNSIARRGIVGPSHVAAKLGELDDISCKKFGI